MWNALRTFEAGDFSSWLREGNFIMEPFATYYVLLGFHSIGMALVVGICFMLTSRILGYQPHASLTEARNLLGLAWWGFWVNLGSGVLLILAQPRREMITVLFWFKMIGVVVAALSMRVMGRELRKIPAVAAGGSGAMEVASHRLRVAAVVATLAWLFAIVSGRLVGYTQPPPPL